MKYILYNLRNFCKMEPLLFVLIMLCVISSAIILHFSYGLYQNYHVIIVEKENEMNELVIEIVDPERVTKQKYEDALLSLSDDMNDAVIMYLVQPKIEPIASMNLENGWGYMEVRFTIRNHAVAPCEIFHENLENYGSLMKGRYFTPEEEENGDLVALLGGDAGCTGSCTDFLTIENNTEAHLVQIGDRAFRVVGEQKLTCIPIIPFNALYPDTPLYHNLLITKERPFTKSEYEEICSVFSAQFGDAIVIPELDLTETEDVYYYRTILLIAAAISVLAAANYAIIYQYMLEKRNKEITIFRMCGCRKSQAISIFLGECLLMIIPAYVFAALIYAKILLPQLAAMFPYMEGSYSPAVYLIIFFIYIGITLTVLAVMISRQIHRKTLLDCKRG
ncbi:MAG: ABC transporter permease [Oscillospiraceae bacterium]|nr:ABC transporter permease [Oscillospiraceae bacterium]